MLIFCAFSKKDCDKYNKHVTMKAKCIITLPKHLNREKTGYKRHVITYVMVRSAKIC